MSQAGPDETHPNDFRSTAVLLSKDGLGHAEPELRHKVLRTFLSLLLEGGQYPLAICLYTEGVKLAVEGSPVIDLLETLQARGIPLIVCQTCLNHFGLADKLRVGIVGGMGDILAAAARSEKVMTP